jgi:hypothetical protein
MHRIPSSLAVALLLAASMIAAPAAYAFNPQPDPPAKSRTKVNTDKTNKLAPIPTGDKTIKTNKTNKVLLTPSLLGTDTGFGTQGPGATGVPAVQTPSGAGGANIR